MRREAKDAIGVRVSLILRCRETELSSRLTVPMMDELNGYIVYERS